MRRIVDEFDECLDQQIANWLAGESHSAEPAAPFAGYEPVAADVNRVLTKNAPRLSASARQRHLKLLREHARDKRNAQRFRLPGIQLLSPRRLQLAMLAVIVVLVANGITNVSASSLPGSPLYPVKRAAEQSGVLLAPTAGGRARAWMNLAAVRLEEVEHSLAGGERADSALLDSLDQNMLLALSEISGTTGAERSSLLQALALLAKHERTELDTNIAQANPADRARLEQTVQLLEGVLIIADDLSAQPTPPPTSLAPILVAPAMAPTQLPTREPTTAPTVQSDPVIAPSVKPLPLLPTVVPTERRVEPTEPPATAEPEKEKTDKSGQKSDSKPDQSHASDKADPPKERSTNKESSSSDAPHDLFKTSHRSHKDD